MDKKIKILFIDREHGEYLLIADILSQVRHVEYQLTWCNQLEAALPKILSQDYDVVLLDYYWGGSSARDLLNAARVQACQTPIVVMTDEMETEVDREAIRAGASDYLIKGQIDCELLERTLRYAIERKLTEQHLARLAHYDPLTDIPNRILFRDRLEHAIRLAERDNTFFTLMFIDLNGFKQVNDNFGHDAGDAVIRICAERLSNCMRRSDSVARMGGDEFTLLLQNIENNTDVAHIAQKVIDSISVPSQIGGYEVVVGCSIGIAMYPQAGRDADTLLKNADLAMYKAKQEDGSSYCFFTDAMNQDVRRQLRLESDLRKALKKEQFFLEYQPRIDVNTGRIIALESLLRWDHPERGILSANEFVAIAEDTGLITAIGYWAIRQACTDLKKLHAVFGEELVMSISLSVRQFKDDRLVQEIATIFSDTGIQAGDIELELTETSFMENIDLVSLCMRPLSFFGINFSLGNFGTGSSSFLHLQRLPITAVKIDSRFMAELQRSRNDRRLVSAMITLARNLGKIVVADGVENDEQKEWLAQSGCDHMQGNYFAEPQSLDEIFALLRGNLLSN
ncbi:putative bifunctional diguanylate cyclase/phosphodiesterase [Cellvibrio sp. ARAG 10.3]|uniref:putative bifunctional diguanylate cyclase/phosphodiesterase n=1 Tax=Cellvibrio sp. ARAG 10.3 TaxID=3451358 RepID=UPI003F45D9EF